MTGCPDAGEVQRFLGRELDSDGRLRIESHVDRCESCRRLVAALAMTNASEPRGDATGGVVGPGATIGRYRIERRLGAGGMGVVYLAHDPELDRNVAVKLLRDRGDGTAERLRREARALAALSHPNVVAIHDVGEHAGQLFIAMEYVDGGSMRDWLAAGPRPWREVIRAMLAAGRGIEAAHAAGLVHRDIKPDNLLVGRDGRIRVTDFGIAASVAPRAPTNLELTQTGAMVGTPAYMPPEQIAAGDVDARSDQFSFCATAFEALYGKRPFAGGSIDAIRDEIVAGRVADTSTARAPRWLHAAIVRGLAASPAARWPAMKALCDELEHRQRRQRRWLIAAGVALAAVVGSAVAWALVPPASCEVERLPADVWSPAREARLAATWPTPVVARIGAWMAIWTASAAELCRRDGDDRGVAERRRRCLADHLDRMRQSLDAWERGAPPKIDIVVPMLPRLQQCSSDGVVGGPAPPPDGQLGAMNRLRARMLGLVVDVRSDPGGAVATAEQLLADARRFNHPPFTTEMLIGFANVLGTLDDAKALPPLREAIALAEAGHDDLGRLEASISLLGKLGSDHIEEGLDVAARARGLVRRIGDVPDLEGRLEANAAALLARTGRRAEAITAHRRALAKYHEAFGPDSDYATITSLALAGLLVAADPNDPEARELLKQVGPRFGVDLAGLQSASATADPIARGQAALALAEHFGPRSPRVADAELGLGVAYSMADNDATALEHFQRAIAIRDGLGLRDAKLAAALDEAAISLLELGRPREALPLTRQAIAVAADAKAETERAAAQTLLGRALIESGDPRAAREPLAESLATRERLGDPAHNRSRTRFLLAVALWTGDAADRRRAVDLARAARVDLQDYLAGLKPGEDFARRWQTKRLAEIDGWLATHR